MYIQYSCNNCLQYWTGSMNGREEFGLNYKGPKIAKNSQSICTNCYSTNINWEIILEEDDKKEK